MREINARLDTVDELLAAPSILSTLMQALKKLPDLERMTAKLQFNQKCTLKDLVMVLDGFDAAQVRPHRPIAKLQLIICASFSLLSLLRHCLPKTDFQTSRPTLHMCESCYSKGVMM